MPLSLLLLRLLILLMCVASAAARYAHFTWKIYEETPSLAAFLIDCVIVIGLATLTWFIIEICCARGKKEKEN